MNQYVIDQPTRAIVRTSSRSPMLTTLSAFPCPSKRSRDSALLQSSTATIATTPHAKRHGTPGYCPISERNSPGGWPAGIHHGSRGAAAAASENVSSLRVNQPLILGRFFQTK